MNKIDIVLNDYNQKKNSFFKHLSFLDPYSKSVQNSIKNQRKYIKSLKQKIDVCWFCCLFLEFCWCFIDFCCFCCFSWFLLWPALARVGGRTSGILGARGARNQPNQQNQQNSMKNKQKSWNKQQNQENSMAFNDLIDFCWFFIYFCWFSWF